MGSVSEEILDCLAEAFRYRQQQRRSFRGWNKIVQVSKQSKAEEKCNLLIAEAEEAKNQSQTLKQEVDGLHLELQQLSAQHADALLAAEKAHSIAVSKIVADCADLRNKMRQQVDMSETCCCPLEFMYPIADFLEFLSQNWSLFYLMSSSSLLFGSVSLVWCLCNHLLDLSTSTVHAVVSYSIQFTDN